MDDVLYVTTDKKSAERTLYSAMVSELARLQRCSDKQECNDIRKFILQCFVLLEDKGE